MSQDQGSKNLDLLEDPLPATGGHAFSTSRMKIGWLGFCMRGCHGLGEIMRKGGDSKDTVSELRRRAESAFAEQPRYAVATSTLPTEDVQRLIHEFQVHQIELEMQNEELRQTQLALEVMRDKYSDLYDSAPVGYFTLDSKGIILEANLTAARLLGTERTSLIRRPFSRFVCREDADTLYLYIIRVLESADTQTCDIRIVGKEDSQFHAHLDAIAVQDSEGQVSGCRMVITDITERRQVEEALRESERRYGAFLNSTTDLAFLKDEEFRYVMVNKANQEFFGKTEAEIIGKTDFELMPPSAARNCRTSDLEALGLRGIVVTEEEFGGRVFETNKFVVKLENGKTGIGGLIREVTDRKRAEQALVKSEAQLSNALIMAHLGHWEYDVTKDLFTFNDHFYKIFRTTVEQVGGYTMSSADYARRFVHPDDLAVVNDEIRKSIETTDSNFSRQVEHRIIYADGEVGHISVRFFVVKDDLGGTVKTCGVNQDITCRKKAEDALKQKMDELERFNSTMVDRELRMIDLKKEINELLKKAGEPERYRIVE